MENSFGKTLKTIREMSGISVSELARMINKSKGYLSDLENDKSPPPSVSVIQSISNVLNVDKRILLKTASKEVEFAINKAKVADFLRMSVEKDYNEEDWEKLYQLAQIANLGKDDKSDK
jgi:transcriptional regulator with XRE-family HTH domain